MQDAREPTTRIRLDLAYDGGHFNGWGRQPSLRTVQGVLEEALAVIFTKHGPTPILTVAGRTDSGVHATGQVAHLDLTARQLTSLERVRGGKRSTEPHASILARRLNGIAGLSTDVYVLRAVTAAPGFDARFSALWRRYEYRVSDMDGPRNPLERHRTLWYPARVNLDEMDAAAASLVGLHDWAAYCKPREGATTIRSLEDFRWQRDQDGVLVARVRADAFCHSMVRSLVGATLAVGTGKVQAAELVVIREQLVRSSEFKVVPAKGLTLVEVGYPPESELQARADLTRARRSVTADVDAEDATE